MHQGNRDWLGKLAIDHPNSALWKILEIGSLDINGSARQYFSTPRYVGVDRTEGPGVDIVCEAADTSFLPGEFDALICLSVFEHDPNWEKTFRHVLHWVRPGGILIVGWGAEGNLRHDPEPWAPVPVASFMEVSKSLPIAIIDAFFEKERFTPDCAGAYNVLALKT